MKMNKFKIKILLKILILSLFLTSLNLLFGSNEYIISRTNNNNVEALNSIQYFKNICLPVYNLSYDLKSLKKQQPRQQDITLLVTFGRSPVDTRFVKDNMIFLNEFYKSFFKTIVFCGPYITSIKFDNDNDYFKYNLLDCNTDQGYMHYRCMSALIDTNEKYLNKTNGILLMSDDVLLKYWNLDLNKTNQIWYTQVPRFASLDLEWFYTFALNEMWIHTPYGRSALEYTFNSIESVLNKSIQVDYDTEMVLIDFIRLLKYNSNQTKSNRIEKFSKEPSDIFYIPQKLFHKFNVISKIFSYYNVFLEMAVPIILTGISENSKVNENLNGLYYWAGQLFELEKDYFNIKHYGHPFKLSINLNLDKRKLLCKYFIEDKLNYDFNY